ncbi:MAG: ATPase domain-containing protein [archaeon]|nr:ATPase domain-containing protein [archaeon]
MPKIKQEDEIEELLSPIRAMDLKILKNLEGMPQNFTYLLLVEPANFSKVNLELVKLFIAKPKKTGVYITSNKSASYLLHSLEALEIDSSNIFFIDAISREEGSDEVAGKNISYVDSPNDLVDLSVKIDELFESIKDKKEIVVIFDSITTLLIYNGKEAVEKFVHSIVGRFQRLKIKGILLMVRSEEHKGVTDEISQFCDKTFDLK